MSVLRPFQPSVDLLRVGHPLDQLLWSWAVGHEECENLLRRLDEKLTLLVLWRLEKGNGESLCFGATAQFLRWSPIGATFIERIQDHIAILRIIKALDELPCWVVDDRCICSGVYLHMHLEHARGFSHLPIQDGLPG